MILFLQILGAVVAVAATFVASLLQYKKPWNDKRTRPFKLAFGLSLLLLPVSLGLTIVTSVLSAQSSTEQKEQLVKIADAVGVGSQESALEAVKKQADELASMKTMIDKVAAVVGAQGQAPSAVLDLVKEQKAQLANIQATLDGIAHVVGVQDNKDLISAIAELKRNQADTAHAIDQTNHRVGDLDQRVSGVAAHVAPRPFDEQAFIDTLKPTKAKGGLDLGCVMNDAEGCALANKISQAFKASGWGAVEVHQSAYTPAPPVGVILRVRSATAVPAHAGNVQHALEAAGLKLTGAENPSLGDGTVELIVGSKP